MSINPNTLIRSSTCPNLSNLSSSSIKNMPQKQQRKFIHRGLSLSTLTNTKIITARHRTKKKIFLFKALSHGTIKP
jgi:hypothetical protein